ncbi:hypothetical protein [Arthrobacter sp. NicSoilB8]|nr:hypothetical protein [Arthrobacter sp. NicSoilB8]
MIVVETNGNRVGPIMRCFTTRALEIQTTNGAIAQRDWSTEE